MRKKLFSLVEKKVNFFLTKCAILYWAIAYITFLLLIFCRDFVFFMRVGEDHFWREALVFCRVSFFGGVVFGGISFCLCGVGYFYLFFGGVTKFLKEFDWGEGAWFFVGTWFLWGS